MGKEVKDVPKTKPTMDGDIPLAAECLHWYEHDLLWWVNWMRRHRRCEPIEAHVILATREDLWQALKTDPQGLTKGQRKRLRELDALLKANARKVVKVLGDDLVRWRRRHKIPRSHWWWFLDKLAEKTSATVRSPATRKTR